MAEDLTSSETLELPLNIGNDDSINDTVPLMQKLVAEVVGTYLMIFSGCAAVVVNLNNNNIVTLPGVATVWGLTVMVLAYTLGHISGAHFNPAVTLAHASTKRFPLKQIPMYIVAQVIGSTLATGSLRLIFRGANDHFTGTLPAGSNLQACIFEFIITFYLMFVISGIATDSRAIGELAGLAVGSTVLLNVLFAGPVTGASMNPARSLGPAIVHNHYKGLWIYIVSPIVGAVAGTWAYTYIRVTNKSVRELTHTSSFLKETKKT